ncbi:PREDICTED: galactose-3-O-sulfotransferase 3-like [Branchiostoma belcheri]|uniref:Galactose-3-O-sulfotransferase 3-like n=1 Tax=Branchiostoma belcheri TaxID=7741 RepID=A0A6P4ZHZ0_BRABE|nr:PREDICTED: galactose-3-O-sulfotransferase 3-like [Branchiostoma belcheri]
MASAIINGARRTKGTCQPHLNVAFMKIHKCGSSLISHMLLRFGYGHNLIVALPSEKGREIIGGFGIIKDDDYVHPPGGQRWNSFVGHHAFYNRTRFRQLMAPNTRYVAILREPLKRLRSAFQYFHIGRFFPGLAKKTPKGHAHFTTYLARPTYWDPRYKPPKEVRLREHVCFRNCMARDLGLAARDYDNHTTVEEFVRGIENDFKIMLILEYLPESLVLLKRRMCWTFYDILYTSEGGHARLQKYRGRADVTDEMKHTFYQHNYADVLLYTRFNESFHKQISQEGSDFQEEVRQFTEVNKDVNEYCRSKERQGKGNMVVEKSKWNDAFSVGISLCRQYGQARRYWDNLLRLKYRHTEEDKN